MPGKAANTWVGLALVRAPSNVRALRLHIHSAQAAFPLTTTSAPPSRGRLGPTYTKSLGFGMPTARFPASESPGITGGILAMDVEPATARTFLGGRHVFTNLLFRPTPPHKLGSPARNAASTAGVGLMLAPPAWRDGVELAMLRIFAPATIYLLFALL